MTLGDLYFILTFFVVLFGVISIVILLIRRNTIVTVWLGSALFGWLALYIIVLFLVSLVSPQTVLAIGQEHCFDEMRFSVQHSEQVASIGALKPTSGTFVIVIVRLQNAARGTAQKPSNTTLYLIDRSGQEFTNSLAGQQQLGDAGAWNERIAPGEKETHRFVFESATALDDLKLVVLEGVGFPTNVIVGDENSWLHPMIEFRLNP
jgi:hypothetical protein